MAKGNGGAPAPNPERGEVAVKVAGVDLVLCVDMERLAKFEAALGIDSFNDLYAALCLKMSTRAMLAALEHLTAVGDWRRAREAFSRAWTQDDLLALQSAAVKAFTAHIRPEDDAPGKAEPARSA